jgi:hypothetical protein
MMPYHVIAIGVKQKPPHEAKIRRRLMSNWENAAAQRMHSRPRGWSQLNFRLIIVLCMHACTVHTIVSFKQPCKEIGDYACYVRNASSSFEVMR